MAASLPFSLLLQTNSRITVPGLLLASPRPHAPMLLLILRCAPFWHVCSAARPPDPRRTSELDSRIGCCRLCQHLLAASFLFSCPTFPRRQQVQARP